MVNHILIRNIGIWVGVTSTVLHFEIRSPYIFAEPFEKATHSWQMLQEIRDATIDDTRYPVVLHGYVTATRNSNRHTDYFNFLDPHLRTMIQVVVNKKGSPAQQTRRPDDASLHSPASYDAVGDF